MHVWSSRWSCNKLSCSLLNDLEFYIAVMKYMGKKQSVVICTFSMYLYFKLVNVKKGIATLGECMRKNCTYPCALRECQISWPVNCGTCWWLTLNIGSANKRKEVLMIGNIVVASKPRICPMSLRKIFFSLPSAAPWCPSCFQPCGLRSVLLLKCLFLTETIACSFLLGREVMVLSENMEKTNERIS